MPQQPQRTNIKKLLQVNVRANACASCFCLHYSYLSQVPSSTRAARKPTVRAYIFCLSHFFTHATFPCYARCFLPVLTNGAARRCHDGWLQLNQYVIPRRVVQLIVANFFIKSYIVKKFLNSSKTKCNLKLTKLPSASIK